MELRSPDPATLISCGSPYGRGGLGQHMAQLVEALRARGQLAGYFATGIKEGDAAIGTLVPMREFALMRRWTPLRLSSGLRSLTKANLFDRKVAARLEQTATRLSGFGGESYLTFRRARRLGFEWLDLNSATGHVNIVARQFGLAARSHGIEDHWLHSSLQRKTIAEYDLADTISVCSEYSRQSFLEAGILDRRLRRVMLHAHSRYAAPVAPPIDGIFRVVYVGALTVAKGVPDLIKAFAAFGNRDAELVLVGRWATRGMRRFMQSSMENDRRIRIASGDPLPHLQRACVYVHPSYHDGFGYAPMEALQCGVPVIVTEDTGMKEYVVEGTNGFVVPTGSWQAILERLEAVASDDRLTKRGTGRRQQSFVS